MTRRESRTSSEIQSGSTGGIVVGRGHNERRGFTIVELLIVIAVIAILTTIIAVSYAGATRRAHETAVMSDVQTGTSTLARTALNSAGYSSCEDAEVTVSKDNELNCRVVPDGSGYCVSVSRQDIVYSATSTDQVPRKGTCEGYILVPGNSARGTRPFWIMKYEAKVLEGIPTSRPEGLPWVNISQTDAIAKAKEACDGCRLINEDEWMTVAENALSVPSNWTGGHVNSGYLHNGHANRNPDAALAASSDDSEGMHGHTGGTGAGASYNKRRTLELSNGEVLWDFAGNVWEVTQGVIEGAQPGLAGETGFVWKSYKNASLQWNSPSPASRPVGTLYPMSKGVGSLYSNSSETGERAFLRGGRWNGAASSPGVFALDLMRAPSYTAADVGFRVTR